MINLNKTAPFSFRSLFMVIDGPCTSGCNSTAVNDLNNNNEIVRDEVAEQRFLLQQAELNCTIEIQKLMKGKVEKSNWCPTIFDTVYCWPQTAPGVTQTIGCPRYIVNFIYEANATKQCFNNGSWNLWSNYSQCSSELNFKQYLAEHLPNYYLITAVGYTVSLIALLASYFIFTFNKRLRSPKNNLHMKLFLSFILRCVLFHIKRLNAYSDDFPALSTSTNTTDLTLSNNMSNKPLACKLFTVIWQFSLLANYNFILMEAVYLQNLISFNTFTDNSSITRYVAFGWGAPAIIVLKWSLVKYYYENNECWITIDNTLIFWIIKGPITICLVLSFIIFINVIRILYSKIFASWIPNQIDRKYSKLFRSTLVLVPLFGVYHTLILVCKVLSFNKEIEVIVFYLDLIFTSFNGFFVALLYCFFSSEVLTELHKSLSRRFRLRKINQSLRHCPSNKMTSNTLNSVLTQSIRQPDKQEHRPIDRQCVDPELIEDKSNVSRSNEVPTTNLDFINNAVYVATNGHCCIIDSVDDTEQKDTNFNHLEHTNFNDLPIKKINRKDADDQKMNKDLSLKNACQQGASKESDNRSQDDGKSPDNTIKVNEP